MSYESAVVIFIFHVIL